MKNIFVLSALLLIFSATLFAQVPSPTKADEDDVVKITTELVQVDAVVTDKKGNPVTDLTADDFEIWQDGKLQKITNFSFINTRIPKTISTSERQRTDKKMPLPPLRTNPGGAGRIITFIIDDGNCAASLVGMISTRQALEKFITEQMQPDDMVAIYRTRGSSSMLQQYTSDKTQLMSVARKIRWYPPRGSCSSTDGNFFEAAGGVRQERDATKDFNRSTQITGTLGVLRYVVQGLELVGGRKLVFLFSDGIPIRAKDGAPLTSTDFLRDLTDLANRSSVVFNVIDIRGVFSPSIIEVRDRVLPDIPDAANPSGSDNIADARREEVRNTQDGMYFLADETGGRFYKGGNYLDTTVRKILNQEEGYYLLAYAPADETFKGKKFHRIQIKVKRPELNVSSRAGFLGKTDEKAKTRKRTGDSELYDAIVAPLFKTGLNLRLTAFFGNTPAEGNFVRSLIHLDGNDITVTEDTGGMKKVVFDVVAVTLNEKNEVVDEFNRTHTLKFDAAALPFIKRNGLVYTTDVPVKKAGTYNFRVAVRDALSKELGSASQIVEIPNLRKDELHLSGLSVSPIDAGGKFIVPAAVKPEEALSIAASPAIPAVRTFRRGMVLAYSYNLYNAEIDKNSNQPKISIQVNLYRDGNLVNEGKPQPAQLEAQADWSRIKDYGYLQLNPNIQTGDYAIELIIKDLLSDKTTSQWIDFEVVE